VAFLTAQEEWFPWPVAARHIEGQAGLVSGALAVGTLCPCFRWMVLRSLAVSPGQQPMLYVPQDRRCRLFERHAGLVSGVPAVGSWCPCLPSKVSYRLPPRWTVLRSLAVSPGQQPLLYAPQDRCRLFERHAGLVSGVPAVGSWCPCLLSKVT